MVNQSVPCKRKICFLSFFGKTASIFGERGNLSIVCYDFCTWKYHLKTALSGFKSSSRTQGRECDIVKGCRGFKNYSVRDCKFPQAISWDQESVNVCKIGDRGDFYLILIKATPSDYDIEVRHSLKRSCPLPRFLCPCLRWRGDARPSHASRGLPQRVKQH